MNRFKLIMSLLLVALTVADGPVPTPPPDEPPIRLYASVFCGACDLRPGSTFQVVLVVYTNVLSDSENLAFVSINPDFPLPNGIEYVTSVSSIGQNEGFTWAGVVTYDHAATIIQTYRIADRGPMGGNGVHMTWYAATSDGAGTIHAVEASIDLYVRRDARLFLPLVATAP